MSALLHCDHVYTVIGINHFRVQINHLLHP